MALGQLFNSNPLLTKVHLNEPGPHRRIALIFRSTYPAIDNILLLKNLFNSELDTYFR